MNELSNITNSTGLTMSTVEIAKVTGKRHDNVVRDTEAVLNELGISLLKFEGSDIDDRGKPRRCYNLPKRETLILTSGYSVKLRAKVIDRWIDLELGASRNLSAAQVKSWAKEIRLQQKQYTEFGKLAGLSGNQLIIAVNKGVKAATGFDVMGSMDIVQLDAPAQYHDLSPTNVGKRMGGLSAQKVNTYLCGFEFQIGYRDAKGKRYYEPTAKGRAAGGQMKDTGKKHSNGTPVMQLMWSSTIIDELQQLIANISA